MNAGAEVRDGFSVDANHISPLWTFDLVHAISCCGSSKPLRLSVQGIMGLKQRSVIQPKSLGSPKSQKSQNGTMSTKPLLPKPLLTDYEESLRDVPWQTDNEYILSGYRRQIQSVKGCLWSAIGCKLWCSLAALADGQMCIMRLVRLRPSQCWIR